MILSKATPLIKFCSKICSIISFCTGWYNQMQCMYFLNQAGVMTKLWLRHLTPD